MASGFVPFELPGGNDPDDILARMFAAFAASVPGWVPRQGHPEVVLMEAAANASAEDRALVASASAAIFRQYGLALLRIPTLGGSRAGASADFVLSDTAGHTIPAGTRLLWDDGAGSTLLLSTADDVIVAPGGSTATGVSVEADAIGTDGNRITAGTAQIVDSLSFLESAALTTDASGGTDDETMSDYADRVADELEAFGATAVTATDFARLARNIAGVDRAFAIDGWSGVEPGTLNNEKTVGLAVVDVDGQPLSAPVKADVDAYLQSLREVNFVVVVTDPTYTDVTVTFTATALPGLNPVDVKANAEAAAYTYLSPAVWGTADGPHSWVSSPVVRRLTLARAISTAEGVKTLDTLVINGSASADLTLTGRVALPSSQADGTTVTGTVT